MSKQYYNYLVITILISILPFSSFAKKKIYENGDFYSGKWKKGKPEGEGKMIYANGCIYEGLWHDGKIAGEGYILEGGNTFEGTFLPIYENEDLVRFKPVRGTFTTQDSQLVGEWNEQNLFHGILTNKDLSFKGIIDLNNSIFKEGRIDGMDGGYIEGTMLLTPQFEGKVSKFVLQESSVLDVPAVYTGEFTKGKFLGHISGSQYSNSINEFEIDIDENGNQFGNIVLKNGGKYRGYIKNKDFNGEGFLEMKDGYFHGIWSNGILTDGNINQWDTNGNKYDFSVKGRKATYTFPIGDTFPNGETITITGIPDGYNKLYSEVVKYEAKYKEEQEELIKKQEEERRMQEQEERKAREVFFQNFNSNYAGLIFQASGASFSDSTDDAFGNALFGFKTDAVMMFLPDGKVTLQTIRKSTRNGSYESMVAASLNVEDNKFYHVVYDGQPGSFYVSELGSKIIVSKDRNSVKYVFPSGRVLSMKGLKNVGPITSTVVPKSMPLGTYKGDLILNIGYEATGFYSLTLMPGNKYKMNMQVKVHNPLFQLVGDTYNDTKEGTYRIENGNLITLNKEGKITEKFTIILGGKGLLCYSPNIKCILTRKK